MKNTCFKDLIGEKMTTTKLRIKELLRERRWTTKVLAEKTGLSESYLTHIKNGTRRWNADSLSKISGAFEIDPTEMFLETRKPETAQNVINVGIDKSAIEISLVPLVGKIPSQPSFTNNRIMQMQSGNENNFVPVMNLKDESMFCIKLDDSSLEPLFHKGDYLIISPEAWTSSGDIVAVEYMDGENKVQTIKKISFTDDLALLDGTNSSASPIAIVRGKDHFRIIGKVVLRYQAL